MKKLFWLLAVLIVTSNAAVFYIPDSFTSIQTAINSVQSYDTLIIRNGTYYELLTIDKPLTIMGVNPDSVFLTFSIVPPPSSPAPVLTIQANNVNVRNVTIKQYMPPQNLHDGVGILVRNANDVHLKNVNVIPFYSGAGYPTPGANAVETYHVAGMEIESGNLKGGPGGMWNTGHYGTLYSAAGNAIYCDSNSTVKVTQSFLSTNYLGKDVTALHGSNLRVVTSQPITYTVDETSVVEITTGNERETAINEKQFLLEQNYPNPFNPATRIAYTVPSSLANSMPVLLKVYNAQGMEAATLVQENKPAGSYEVQFNATNLSSGIYFYTLQIGKSIETKKMVVLK